MFIFEAVYQIDDTWKNCNIFDILSKEHAPALFSFGSTLYAYAQNCTIIVVWN